MRDVGGVTGEAGGLSHARDRRRRAAVTRRRGCLPCLTARGGSQGRCGSVSPCLPLNHRHSRQWAEGAEAQLGSASQPGALSHHYTHLLHLLSISRSSHSIIDLLVYSLQCCVTKQISCDFWSAWNKMYIPLWQQQCLT